MVLCISRLDRRDFCFYWSLEANLCNLEAHTSLGDRASPGTQEGWRACLDATIWGLFRDTGQRWELTTIIPRICQMVKITSQKFEIDFARRLREILLEAVDYGLTSLVRVPVKPSMAILSGSMKSDAKKSLNTLRPFIKLWGRTWQGKQDC